MIKTATLEPSKDDRPPGAPILETRGLEKRFGPTEALRGVDLAIAPGEMIAITGPSGSGKSTLLHCLSGIFQPDAGEVWFDGERIDDRSDDARTKLRRTAFGFVFQFGQLVPELPAVENVLLPLLFARRKRKDAHSEAMGWLERLGVAEEAAKLPAQLSGGQQQRVALARALVMKPRVVFADEPTGALDSLGGEQVMDLLAEISRDLATTVVLVTHEARVAAYAAREIVLRDGRVEVPEVVAT